MRYWLIYDPRDKSYLILDTKTGKSSNDWGLLNNIFDVPISDLIMYDKELYNVNMGYFQKLIEFPSFPTYTEFCKTYPELCI